MCAEVTTQKDNHCDTVDSNDQYTIDFLSDEELSDLVALPVSTFEDLQHIVCLSLLKRHPDFETDKSLSNSLKVACSNAKLCEEKCRTMNSSIKPGRIPNRGNILKFKELLYLAKELSTIEYLFYKVTHSSDWIKDLDKYTEEDFLIMESQLSELNAILTTFLDKRNLANPFFTPRHPKYSTSSSTVAE